MTDTTISGAVVFPQDAGSGVPENEEDYSSAGFFSLLSKYKGEGSYVGEDTSGTPTLQFNDVDTSNEQVDISTGYAYVMDSMSVQSGFQTVYDVALPNESPYVVILPDEVVNLDLGTDNVNDLWLAADPTSNDSVYIRHGNGLTAPSDPSVKLGTVDTSSGATTRTNDGAPSGAFRDDDGDDIYTLPNSTDGIDVGSVSAGYTEFRDQLIYVLSSSDDYVTTVDPSNTATPIQDAVDVTGSSRLLLPPGTIQTPGNITGAGEVDIIGAGAHNTFVEVTSDSNDGFDLNPSGGFSYSLWHGFKIRPQNTGSRSGGAAIRFSGETGNWNVGTLHILDWNGGSCIDMSAGAGPFGGYVRNIKFDPADDSPIFNEWAGNSQAYGVIYANPNGGAPLITAGGGANSYTVDITADRISFGGEPGAVMTDLAFATGRIDEVRYEPNSTYSVSGAMFRLAQGRPFRIGGVFASAANGVVTFDDVYKLDGDNGGKILGPVSGGGLSINNDIVDVNGAPVDPVNNPNYYYGPDSDVDDNSGDGAVRCLASAGTASTNI